MSSITEFESYLDQVVKEVYESQTLHRSIEKRKKHLENKGYHLEFKNVPSGGVGSVFELENGEFRIQVGYTKGYKALCIILNPFD